MCDKFTIIMTWDPEACVWIATSDDIPGLILESESFRALINRIRSATPDLLSANMRRTQTCDISFLVRCSDYVAGTSDTPVQRLLTVNDIMQIFGVGKNRAYELMHSKGFPTITIGTEMRVNPKALQKWIDDNTGRTILI